MKLEISGLGDDGLGTEVVDVHGGETIRITAGLQLTAGPTAHTAARIFTIRVLKPRPWWHIFRRHYDLESFEYVEGSPFTWKP